MPSDENITKKYLYEWFLENDSLVIPDLGKFETSYLGAKLQPAAHKVLPPNKTIFFDSSQKEDDQVLASFIAEQEGIPLAEAQKNIKLFVTTVKAELGIQKKYKVENLGTFVWAPGDTIGFQPDDELNYLGDSFGLPDLYNLKPGTYSGTESSSTYYSNTNNNSTTTTIHDSKLIDDEDDPLFDPVYGDKDYVEEPADEPVESSRGRLFTVSAITLLLLSAATAYFLFTDQNPLSFFSSKDPANSKNNANKDTTTQEDTKHLDFDGNDETPTSEEDTKDEVTENTESNTESTENTPENETSDNSDENPLVDYATNNNFVNSFVYNPATPANVNSVLVNTPQSRYYVVLGSFSKIENAYSFYNNLLSRGVSTAKIISPGGSNTYYRVSCLDFATQKDAEAQGKAFGKQRNLFVLIYPY